MDVQRVLGNLDTVCNIAINVIGGLNPIHPIIGLVDCGVSVIDSGDNWGGLVGLVHSDWLANLSGEQVIPIVRFTEGEGVLAASGYIRPSHGTSGRIVCAPAGEMFLGVRY